MLSLVARVQAKPGLEKEVEAELRRLVPITLAENGCINYDLHRSIEKPGLFVLYENWESRPVWEAHMAAPHLQEFSKRAEEIVAEWGLDLLERVDVPVA